ncbi:MAG TPA: hypothetical protein VIM11_16130 [Tepidisphaeraceae bacterium]
MPRRSKPKTSRKSIGVKTQPRRDGASSSLDSWALTLTTEFQFGRADATLRSEHLDRALHPRGKATVRVAGNNTYAKPGFVVDQFAVESVGEYVRIQAYLRKMLERELQKDQLKSGVKKPAERTELWRRVKIEQIYFNVKSVPKPGGFIANLMKKMPKADADRMLKRADNPKTKSAFMVELKVPWDDEHEHRLATFRDGKFVTMTKWK